MEPQNSPFQPLGSWLLDTLSGASKGAGEFMGLRQPPALSPLANQSSQKPVSMVPSPVSFTPIIPRAPLEAPRRTTMPTMKDILPRQQKVISPIQDVPQPVTSSLPQNQGLLAIQKNNPNPAYGNKTFYFEPKLYDAIAKIREPDIRNLLFALAGQESGGGKTLMGDAGQSWGPYHINDIRGIPREKAMDPEWSTQYAYNEIMRRVQMGQTPEQALRSWNYNSGYQASWINEQGVPQYGPRYDIDIPYMAKTSTFLRGE